MLTRSSSGTKRADNVDDVRGLLPSTYEPASTRRRRPIRRWRDNFTSPHPGAQSLAAEFSGDALMYQVPAPCASRVFAQFMWYQAAVLSVSIGHPAGSIALR